MASSYDGGGAEGTVPNDSYPCWFVFLPVSSPCAVDAELFCELSLMSLLMMVRDRFSSSKSLAVADGARVVF